MCNKLIHSDLQHWYVYCKMLFTVPVWEFYYAMAPPIGGKYVRVFGGLISCL
jgi:hypothetical protein